MALATHDNSFPQTDSRVNSLVPEQLTATTSQIGLKQCKIKIFNYNEIILLQLFKVITQTYHTFIDVVTYLYTNVLLDIWQLLVTAASCLGGELPVFSQRAKVNLFLESFS